MRVTQADLLSQRFGRLTHEQLASALYDYHAIDAVKERHDFFHMPQGYHDSALGRCRTRLDTSMHIASCLPMGNTFLCTGIRVLFVPDAVRHRHRMRKDRQDAGRVLLGGELRLVIANRDYVTQGPLARFPACLPKTWMGELAYLSAEDEEPHWRLLYDPALPRIAAMAYHSLVPLLIQSQQYFRVEINHEAGPLNAPGKLGVILDGRLMREGS